MTIKERFPMQLTAPNPTYGKKIFGRKISRSSSCLISRQSPVRQFSLCGPAILVFLAVGVQLAHGAAGTLDQTFGRGGRVTTDFNGTTDIAYAIALQPDGKIVVAGITYANNDYSKEDFAVVRYNPNGTRDTTFGANGKVTTDFPNLAAVPSAVVIQPDGKILVAGGAFPLFTFLGDIALVRYNANGSLDSSFGHAGIVRTRFSAGGSYAFDVALLPNGKIIIAGTVFVDFSSDDSSNTDFALVRYNPNGAIDPTFGNGGGVITDFDGFNDDAHAILIQSDGKIVAIGSAKNPAHYYDFALARYFPNGTLDAGFGVGGKVRSDFGASNLDIAYCAALQSNGKIVAAGTATLNDGSYGDFAIARYNANGTLDTNFSQDGRVTIEFGSILQSAYSVLVQPNAKIVTVGYPNSESSDSDFLLARLNPNGSPDSTFGVAGRVRTSFGDLNDGANAAILQPDGKILAAGFHPTTTRVGVDFIIARYLTGP
jgi:uncharacterized delta-60 repeat protein